MASLLNRSFLLGREISATGGRFAAVPQLQKPLLLSGMRPLIFAGNILPKAGMSAPCLVPGSVLAPIHTRRLVSCSSLRFGAYDFGRTFLVVFHSRKAVSWCDVLHDRGQHHRLGSGGARSLCASTVGNQVVVNVPIIVEDSTIIDANQQAMLEQFEKDAPQVVKLAVGGLEEVEGKTVELSILICNDSYIQELNSQWRGKNTPTDVLSFAQDQAPGQSPIWLLGDVVISMETAVRQAKERGHSLLDEMRILLVHGLLHVLGYDHEVGPEEAKDMEDEEKHILHTLGWKGDGLINSALQDGIANDAITGNPQISVHTPKDNGEAFTGKTVARRRKPPFKLLFCDMDGTLLNSQTKVSKKTADAVRAAIACGVQVVIATGKARPAAIAALDAVGLAYNGGAISLSSPGVFLQGLLVYGREGTLIHRKVLPSNICSEAFKFSLEHGVPLVGFAGDRCVTMFEHQNLDVLHSVYYEPKAEVMPSIEDIVTSIEIQKLLYYDSKASVANFLRPHWSLAANGRATVVQAVPEMLEILPAGASKGAGVQHLLNHLGIPAKEVMAIGDGENDMEMLQLAGLGVAMANGAASTLAVADVQVGSNDDDGVAEAIERFIL